MFRRRPFAVQFHRFLIQFGRLRTGFEATLSTLPVPGDMPVTKLLPDRLAFRKFSR
jgi:hypothetical protein